MSDFPTQIVLPPLCGAGLASVCVACARKTGR